MANELDYRLLLEQAQQCRDEIDQFVNAVAAAPQADARTRELAAATAKLCRDLDLEIEQLWDHFKRLKAPA